MSSTIYDKDCSIIKKPVTSDEFRKEIDLLKEEIVNLKKEIELSKSKNLINFDVIDKIISVKYEHLIKYLNLIIASSNFKGNGRDIIKYEKIHYISRDGIDEFLLDTESYNFLKRRNLCIILPTINSEPIILLKYDNNLSVNLIETTEENCFWKNFV